MIVEGKLSTVKRPEFSGKPYTFDLDRDFLHVTIYDRQVAFSDYFPRQSAPNEYIILDFDREGRVVGIAVEGLLREWAARSLQNRAKSAWMRTRIGAQSVSLASKVVAELSRRAFFESFPQFDANGRLPAYAI
jgi:hypothetical protein